MSSPSTEPIAIQTLGQPFFRQYMAKYPDVFQAWILDVLNYECTISYEDKLFAHVSEVPRGYEIGKKINKKAKNREPYEPKEGWYTNDPLTEAHDFTYYANIRHKGKTKFEGNYIIYKLIEVNDSSLVHEVLKDYTHFLLYTDVELVNPLVMYIGDYPFHSPTKIDQRMHQFCFDCIDLTQQSTDTITQHPDFHIHVLAMFNHQMPEAEKVDFIVSGMVRTYEEKGVEEAEYYFRLVELTETPKNLPALNQVLERLAAIPAFQPLQRNTLAAYPRTLDPVEQQITQMFVDKALTVMYKKNEDALGAARTMNLKPVEFQMLLHQIEAMGGVVKAKKQLG
jgi:hypothetical protein